MGRLRQCLIKIITRYQLSVYEFNATCNASSICLLKIVMSANKLLYSNILMSKFYIGF